jgi:hypothetical protein
VVVVKTPEDLVDLLVADADTNIQRIRVAVSQGVLENPSGMRLIDALLDVRGQASELSRRTPRKRKQASAS